MSVSEPQKKFWDSEQPGVDPISLHLVLGLREPQRTLRGASGEGFSGHQAGRGWIISLRLFPASFPAGDHARGVRSWKQKPAGVHMVRHQGSGPPSVGCQPLANSASGAQQAPGVSLSGTLASCLACPLRGRLPSCQLLQWHQGKPSPHFLPRCQGSSSRTRGAKSPGALVQGASSASSGTVKCASWIAAAAAAAAAAEATAVVAGDQEGWRRQPAASWGGRRRGEEVKARLLRRLLRAWRSGGQHCGGPGAQRGPAQRTHPSSQGCPGPGRAGARGSAASGREIQPPPRF